MATEDIGSRHRNALGAGAPLFYDEPIHLVRGDGVWLFDEAGRRYLDAYNNVPCVGHANERVAQAMARQASTLNVHSRYMHGGVVDYAERLAALSADPLTTLVFTCTGTEANDVAMMMARAATGRTGIITTDSAYHGNSTEVRKLSSIGARRAAGESVSPEVGSVPVPDAAPLIAAGLSPSEATEHHLELLSRAIADMEAGEYGFAGVLMCSLLANEGLPDIPPEYMAGAVELVRRAGGVFIADEVQAGFARSGRWWGYEKNSFVPDIAVMGKPMGAGLPVAGVIASQELVGEFRRTARYFNTFAASPLQAAVGMAVLDEIEDRGLVTSVAEVGSYLLDRIRSAVPVAPSIGAVRGVGLFVGVDFLDGEGRPDPVGAQQVVNAMKDRGVLMGKSGAAGNCLKFRPPLVFERQHVDVVVEAFAETIKEQCGS